MIMMPGAGDSVSGFFVPESSRRGSPPASSGGGQQIDLIAFAGSRAAGFRMNHFGFAEYIICRFVELIIMLDDA